MEEASTQSGSQNIRIRIRTLRPSTHELTVPAELQVGELKDRLVELTGVLHERQRLLFAGHALQDDQRLRERGVRDGHTIHLVERLEGANAGPPPPPPGGVPMPGQQPSGTAGSVSPQANWISQLLGGLAGPGPQGAAPGGIPPLGTAFGAMPGFGPSTGQQHASAAAQPPQQPATALLSLVHHFITHLSSQHPAAAQPPPATVPYVLPEGRRQDSERRWFTAAQEVLNDAQLSPDVRRFVETSTAASLAATTAGSDAGRQQASQGPDVRLATTVAVALGELLRQTGELWRGQAADVLLAANTALSRLSQPIRPGQAPDAIAQLQLANAQLFSVGALAWELSRMSSMLLPALSGSTALPLATGRPAFINASGTAPIMPMRVQPGLAGLNMLGLGGALQQQPQGGTPVTVRLPNGAAATGYFTGEPPSEADFLQQLQYILGGQFGLPRPGERPPPQPAAAAGGASAAGGSGGQTARTGRRAGVLGHSQPPGSQTAAADTEMPDLVADSGSSEYESEWEEEGEGDGDAAAQSEQARGPHIQGQRVQLARDGVMPPNPAISITFDNQMGMGGRWPFPGMSADTVPGFMSGGQMAGSGAPMSTNAWQTLLNNPRMGAMQQELGRLVCASVMPIVTELLSQPQAGDTAEAATADFVQNLSQRISTALQPSLATIHRMVQAVVPVLQASASNRAAAVPQPDAGPTQAQRGAAAPQPSAQPPSAAPAAEAMAEDRGAPSATAAAAGHDSGEQQWAYIPTTTVSAEITVEPMDTAGHPVAAGDATAGPQAGASQTNNVMAALSASMPAIQQALMDAMRPQQPVSAPAPDATTAATPAAADTDRGAGDSGPADTATAIAQSSGELGTGHPAADARASAGGSGPAGLGSSALPRPSSGRSCMPQPAAPGGIGAGLGLPPRPAPARRRLAASQRSGNPTPSSTARTASDPEAGAAAPQPGQLGTMLASMLGGANNATGSSGGGFAQMLGQIASSPAMQQLASSPTVQNAMQPLLSGGNDASGRPAAGQVDFGALMNEMGPVLAQLMGSAGGNPALGAAANTTILPTPAAGSVQDVADRPHSAPPTSATDGAHQGGVDPAVEQVIRSQLPGSEVDSWLQTLRRDAEDMRASERRPLSSSYRAGSVHPSSSSAI